MVACEERFKCYDEDFYALSFEDGGEDEGYIESLETCWSDIRMEISTEQE